MDPAPTTHPTTPLSAVERKYLERVYRFLVYVADPNMSCKLPP